LYEASKKNGESLRVQVEDVRMDLLKAQKALIEKKEAMDQLLAEDAEVHQKSLQHDNLKAEYAALKAVMSTKETESNQLKQIISRLNSSYDKLKLDTSDLQKANDELMKTNVDLESKLGSERLDLDQSMNEIRGQVETSSTALKTCQEDVRQKNEIIDSLIKEVEDETAKGQSLEANFEAERSKVANLEGRLEAEKANVKNELLELTKRNKTMEDKCLKMEDNIIKAAEDKSMIRVKIEEAGKIKSEAEQNMSDLNDHQTDFKVSGSAANAASVTTTRTSTSSEKASEAAIVTKLKARLEKYKIQIKSGTKIVHEHAQMKVREEAVNAKIKDFKATKASFEKLTKEHKKLKSILRIREDEIKVLKDEDDRSDEEFVDKFIVK
jgi:chromosome segregation ATPase